MRLAYWYMLLIIPLILFLFFRKGKKSALKFSNTGMIKSKLNKYNRSYKLGRYMILLSCILFVIALARPQIAMDKLPHREDGIDIAMLLDVSGSMESVDFEPNRLEVAKDTMVSFTKQRSTDRLALILFAGNAYTRIPLTLDHDMVMSSISEVDVTAVQEKGTAIGMAISVGMNRLKNSDASSKIMILVTDGENNAGAIDPLTASELAKELGIKIYTIGVGTEITKIPYTSFGRTQYQITEGGLDEELLKAIAEKTGGNYYRAMDQQALNQIFEEINNLEKTEFEYDNFRDYEEYAYLIMKIAFLLLLLGLFIDRYYYIQIP